MYFLYLVECNTRQASQAPTRNRLQIEAIIIRQIKRDNHSPIPACPEDDWLSEAKTRRLRDK
jgi:hypothetical protein